LGYLSSACIDQQIKKNGHHSKNFLRQKSLLFHKSRLHIYCETNTVKTMLVTRTRQYHE
jgi:hypothetical protein